MAATALPARQEKAGMRVETDPAVAPANSSLQRENALLGGQMRVLEMVARGAPLAATLAELTRFIESQEEGLRCGILILDEDGRHFRRSIGPNLPEAYHQALADGTPIAPPHRGPCGQAAHRREAVVVPDIAADCRWTEAWRNLALSCGLKACRSTPVIASDGTVLASFAMYYDRPRDPSPAHPQLIEIAAHLAGIALERERSHAALRNSEERLRAIFNVAAIGAAILTPEARFIRVNDAFCTMTGYSREELRSLGCADLTHPEDCPHTQELIESLLAGRTPNFVVEKRYIRKDGAPIWVQNSVSLVRDEAGRPRHLVAVCQDATERKRAEAAQRRAYQETADILESIDDAFFAVDREWRLTYVNRPAETLWGKRREELLARNIWEVFPEAVGTPIHDAMQRAMRERRAFSCEALSAVTHSWLRGAFYPSRIGVSAYLRDISERKEAEAALRQSRENLEAALAASDTGTFRWNPDTGEFLAFDDNLKRLFGFAPDEPVRATEDFIARVHPEDVPAVISGVESCRAGADFAMEYRVVLPDGGVRWLYDRARMERGADGSLTYLVGACTDITRRKEAEAKAREVGERFRFITQSMAQKIFTAKPNGEVDFFNQQWMEFTGLGFDEIKNWGWTQFIHPDDVEENVRVWRHSLATGAPFQFMHRFRRADGAYRWHLSRAYAMRDAAGRITMWIGSNTDIHEQKEIEKAYRELSETLERQVADRTRALEAEMAERQKAEAALQQVRHLEAIGQLTGGVAHDFNNLLTVIAGQAELIDAVGPDSRLRRHVAAIERATERGARLTGQLLAFARRQQLHPEPVTIAAVMANIDDLVRRAVGEAVVVEFRAAPDLWPSLVDPAQFESAILNLAINARDAMPEGGRLDIAARNATLAKAEAWQLDVEAGDYVVVRVADTGIGMPAEVRDHAFEPFFTTKDVGKGTGLGLAQIYGFVRQSGGAVTLDSAVGKGTAVSLYLPRAQAAAERGIPTNMPAAAEAGHGRTVLVVEDQPEVRDVIEASLSELGYRVLTAADGVEAQLLLDSEESIDLLLTDIVMPNGVSGLELAERARRLRQDIKILLVSGYSRDAQIRPGGFAFLEKPFRLAQLAEAVTAALGAVPA
ncbi:MAG TPA: PAS domain S-box protein [Stellaceae bacterium]|nr:PAS domain S-box protein [Stellaceae bacterium]